MSQPNIYEEYLPLVLDIVKRYQHLGVPREDLIQEGMIGLMEAEKRFDAKYGTKFSTYAVYWIKKQILAAVDKEHKSGFETENLIEETAAAPAAAPSTRTSQYLNLPHNMPRLERRVLRLLYEEERTLKEIAELLEISREKVRQLKEKAMRRLRAHKEKER
ncbi:MAG: sigma-70 family RNA polymerase sigma factor [Candidatus Cloacimonadales bacterium]